MIMKIEHILTICWFTLNKLNTTSNKLVAIHLITKSKSLNSDNKSLIDWIKIINAYFTYFNFSLRHSLSSFSYLYFFVILQDFPDTYISSISGNLPEYYVL